MCSIFILLGIVAILFMINPAVTALVLIPLTLGIMYAAYDKHKREKKRDEQIVSAEVISRTQIMREECQTSGFSFGFNGNPRVYMRFKQVPSYIQVRLAVVYEDGKHAELTLSEGENRYKRIMAICEKRRQVPAKVEPVSIEPPEPSAPQVDYIDIKTNQLVAGVYVIGDAIPEGNYDLKWVWGSGSVHKYVDNTTLLGASNLFQWVGNTRDYEQRVLVNVVCKSGEYLHIDGNLIVEIRKSKPVVLEL